MAKIGLLGGTFDPIHNGHIRIAREAYQQLQLDEVWFVPVLNNPFSKNIVATNIQRINMIHLATSAYPYMKVCDIELKQSPEKKSYTFNTLKALKEKYDHTFYFMIGYDQAELFEKWYKAREISEMVHLVVFNRLGYLKSENIERYHMTELDLIPSDASSTKIKEGDVSQVDDKVLDYMMTHSIYTKSIIRHYMSEKRYRHSVSVADTARMFARNNHLDENKAYIAGLLHDIAKEMPEDQMRELMNRYYPEHLDASMPVWHQWLSSYVCKHVYKINDSEILQAIENHTTASINMSLLDMCIYCADKYEPTRDFDSSKEIEICNQNILAGFKYALKDFYEFSKRKGRSIDPIFFEIYKKYVEEDLCE